MANDVTKWTACETGVLDGPTWVITNNPGPDGRIMSAENAAALNAGLRSIRQLRAFAQDLLASYQRFAFNADGLVDEKLVERARELGLVEP